LIWTEQGAKPVIFAEMIQDHPHRTLILGYRLGVIAVLHKKGSGIKPGTVHGAFDAWHGCGSSVLRGAVVVGRGMWML
jgi:hypothetical protein